MNSKEKTENLSLIINAAQLATMLLGIAGAGIYLGSAHTSIENNKFEIMELRSITTDLAAASIAGSTASASHSKTLDELLRRIERLEINNAEK